MRSEGDKAKDRMLMAQELRMSRVFTSIMDTG